MDYTKYMSDFLCASTDRVLFKDIDVSFLSDSDIKILSEIGVPADSYHFELEESIELELDEDYGDYFPIGRVKEGGVIVILDDGSVQEFSDDDFNYINSSLEEFLGFIYEYVRFENEMNLKYNKLKEHGFPFVMDMYIQPEDVDELERRFMEIDEYDTHEIFWMTCLDMLRGK